MSLFHCITLIDQALKSSTGFFSFAKRLYPADLKYLQELRSQFQRRIENDNYKHLRKDIKHLKRYIKSNPHLENDHYFMSIIDLLIRLFDTQICNNASLESPAYEKFQTSEYKIADANHAQDYRISAGEGVCFGYTLGMVDPDFSPYINKNHKFHINQKIYNYQINQKDAKENERFIKQYRLTREYFCPDFKTQAKEICQLAEHYPDRDLALTRKSGTSRFSHHAMYLSLRSTGEIWYAEPNHGAYIFKNHEDFIEFFVVASQVDRASGLNYKLYSLKGLIYDELDAFPRSNNWEGKWRTFLTGAKYSRTANLMGYFCQLFIAICLGLFIGGLIALSIPAVAANAIAYSIATLVFITLMVSLTALIRGNAGFLNIYHCISVTWHNFLEEKVEEEYEELEFEGLNYSIPNG